MNRVHAALLLAAGAIAGMPVAATAQDRGHEHHGGDGRPGGGQPAAGNGGGAPAPQPSRPEPPQSQGGAPGPRFERGPNRFGGEGGPSRFGGSGGVPGGLRRDAPPAPGQQPGVPPQRDFRGDRRQGFNGRSDDRRDDRPGFGSRPDFARPDFRLPDSGRPDFARPGFGRPDAGRPGAGPEGAGRPGFDRRGHGRPDYGRAQGFAGGVPGRPDWRGDRRYDWRAYREGHRDIFRGPRYVPPRGYGYGYRRFGVGFRLAPLFFASDYWIGDPGYYDLPPAYGPYRWVRYYNDVLLVDLRTGEIVDEIPDFFL